MAERTLIIAYAGTGKSYLQKYYSNVVDHNFIDYRFTYDESVRHLPVAELGRRGENDKLRTLNPEWPSNFIKVALVELDKGNIVMSSFVPAVYEALNSNEFKENAGNTRIFLVCPKFDCWDEYEARFRARNSDDAFVDRKKAEFPILMALFQKAKGFEKITMKQGQFLSEVLIKHGIKLNKKQKINLQKTSIHSTILC